MSVIKKCLFPTAGYGTRFLPATKSMPKEMLPIVTKPLIQYGVEEAMDAGISEIAIVTGRGKRAIEDHFDISYELEHQIAGSDKEELLQSTRDIMERCIFSYTRQVEMKGPFAVVLADDYCITEGDGLLTQMVKLYEKYQCSIVAIEEVPEDETYRYGVIEGDLEEDNIYRVRNMVEKPAPEDAPSNLAIIGRYILSADIFDVIRNTPPGKNGEMQITDALQLQAQQGKVIGYRFTGRRFDCGSVDGFIEATNFTYQSQSG
jgi:UTP--glucose-1-phosphate uridylyltransferase